MRKSNRLHHRSVPRNGGFVRCVSILLVLLVLGLPARAQDSCSTGKGIPVGMQGVMCAYGNFSISLAGKTANGSGFFCDGQHDWTNKVWPELIPDKTYVMTAGTAICVTSINFDVPAGYTLEINGIEATTVDKTQGGLIFTGDGSWNVVLRKKCSCGKQGGGDGGLGQGSVIFDLGMGYLTNGRSAEQISIRQETLSAATYTPASLIYSPPAGSTAVDVVRDAGGNLRQVKAPQAFADVVAINSSEFDVRYYDPANVGTKVNGIYTLTGQPYVTWKISNPSPTTTTKLRISKIQGGVTVDQSEYTWDPAVDSWTLSTGGASGTYARVETKTVSYPTQTSRMETFIVKDASGQIATKRTKTYLNYPWGWELVQEVQDPDAVALTKTYDYYNDPTEDSPSQVSRYRKLKSVTFPDGSWEKYDYDWFGNLASVMRPWKDLSLATATEANSRLTIYGYSNSDNGVFGINAFPKIIYDIEEKIAGITTHKTRYNRSQATLDPYSIAEAESLYSGSDNGVPTTLITQTITTRYHWSAPEFLANRVSAVEYPDGRKDYYSYEKGNYVTNPDPSLNQFTPDANGIAERVTIVHGTNSLPAGIAFRTTKDSTVHDQYGNSVLQETSVYNGTDYERIAWTANDYDTRGHLLSSRDSRGQLSTAVWNGDLKTSEIDAGGMETVYTYDGLSRLATSTKKGIAAGAYPAQADIVTTFAYDGDGRQTGQTVTGGSLSLTSQTTYDRAGRVVREKDPANLETTYSYANGGRTQTVTRPGGATEVSDNYLDGQSKSVSGSAVVAQYFDYGVNADGTRYVQKFTGTAGLSSPRWTKTTSDWVDRTVSVERPSFTGNTVVQTATYNSLSQLQKQTTTSNSTKVIADQLYEYDQLGQLSRSGRDVNNDGVLSLQSTDRINEQDQFFEKTGTDWFLVNPSKTYLTDNDATPTTRTSRARLTNFPLTGSDQKIAETTITDVVGNTTTTTTTVDRAAKKKTTTDDIPDSTTNEVSITVNGLLQSASSTTPETAKTFTYDSLGRELITTDPRAGTTSRTYNSSGQLDSLNDGAGTATFEYYDPKHLNAGRLKSQTNAAGKKAYFAYSNRGEMTQTWGDATYPLEYVYDGYGQRAELHTFRAGQNWQSTVWPASTIGTADVTKWIYQESTGLLAQKQDAALKGPTFTYDELGRIKTRVWARGISCTYGYDSNTGELSTVTYSDSTPSVAFAYDRGGRQKQITDAAGVRTRGFNAQGNLQSEQIAGGILDGTSLSVGYDAYLRKSSLQVSMGANSLAAQTYGYDASSRLETVTSGGQTATYAYHPNSGLLTTTTFTGGTVVARGYDTMGRLQNITTTPAADVAQSYTNTYNNLHQRTRVTREDGSYWSYTYNDRGELIFGKKYWTDSSVVWGAQTEYTFDNAGNRKYARNGGNQVGTLRQSDFTTNALNAYSQRTVPGAVDITGSADASSTVSVNNLPTARKGEYFYKELGTDNSSAPTDSQINVVGAKNNVGTNGQDVVAAKSGSASLPPATETFVYDDDGNTTSDGRWTYTWDAENRLTALESKSSVSAAAKRRLEFAYDGMGHRVLKKVYTWDTGSSTYVLQSTTKFVYDGWDLVAELDGSNALTKSFTWGRTSVETPRDVNGLDLPLFVSSGGNIYQVGADANGNVASLIKASTGKIAAAYEYDPFGNLLKSSGDFAAVNPLQFSAKYADAETNLLNYGYRFYRPELGRWINRDPGGEAGGINLYAFLANNPTNFRDHMGLRPLSFVFDAFILGERGDWLPEPYSWTYEFSTDGRGFGEFDANKRNARLFSVGIIDTDAIGHAEKGGVKLYSDTGDSHRKWNETRQSFIPYPPYILQDVVERIATKKAALSKDITKVQDWDSCTTIVVFKEAAAYPFVEFLGISLSPNIDYRAEFTFQKKGDTVKVKLEGGRNAFPDYEGYVDGHLIYKWKSNYDGPGFWDLGYLTGFITTSTIEVKR